MNMNPLTWFKPKTIQAPRPKVVIIQRDPLRVTPEEARKDPEFVRVAATALKSQPLRGMLDVLWAGHLGRRACIGTTEERVAHANWMVGYTLALNDLESLGVLDVRNDAPPEDFAPENAKNL
jgi:hypothetical protein